MTGRIKKKKKRLELIRKIESMGYGDGIIMLKDGFISIECCHISMRPSVTEHIVIGVDALTKDGLMLLKGMGINR